MSDDQDVSKLKQSKGASSGVSITDVPENFSIQDRLPLDGYRPTSDAESGEAGSAVEATRSGEKKCKDPIPGAKSCAVVPENIPIEDRLPGSGEPGSRGKVSWSRKKESSNAAVISDFKSLWGDAPLPENVPIEDRLPDVWSDDEERGPIAAADATPSQPDWALEKQRPRPNAPGRKMPPGATASKEQKKTPGSGHGGSEIDDDDDGEAEEHEANLRAARQAPPVSIGAIAIPGTDAEIEGGEAPRTSAALSDHPTTTDTTAATTVAVDRGDSSPPGSTPQEVIPTAFVVDDANTIAEAKIVDDEEERRQRRRRLGCLGCVALVAVVVAATLGVMAGTGRFDDGTAAAAASGPTEAPTPSPTEAPTPNPTHACPWSKIVPPDGNRSDVFGDYLALDGDTALIAARHDDDNGEDSGSAYVFTRSAGGEEGGSGWTLQAKLTASDGGPFDEFGEAVDLDGDTAVIGAELDDTEAGGEDSGSVYVFTRTAGGGGGGGGTMTWTEQAKLVPSALRGGDWFGTSVAIDGDTLLVGASGDDTNGSDGGAAYVFVRRRRPFSGISTAVWEEQAKLVLTDGTFGTRFGVSVALDKDTAVIGADFDYKGASSGAAYVFVRNGTVWTEQAKLEPDNGDPDMEDSFGHAVAVDGDTVLVGADGDNVHGNKSGSAFLFVRADDGTWTLQAKIFPRDGDKGDRFGRVVAMEGNNVIVGAYGVDKKRGAAYVFTRTGEAWEEVAKLSPNVGESGDRFGNSVAISGGTVLVGAKYDEDNGKDSGSAYTVELCY